MSFRWKTVHCITYNTPDDIL